MALGQVGALLPSGGGAAEGPRGGGSRAFCEVPVRPQPRPFPHRRTPAAAPPPPRSPQRTGAPSVTQASGVRLPPRPVLA